MTRLTRLSFDGEDYKLFGFKVIATLLGPGRIEHLSPAWSTTTTTLSKDLRSLGFTLKQFLTRSANEGRTGTALEIMGLETEYEKLQGGGQ